MSALDATRQLLRPVEQDHRKRHPDADPRWLTATHVTERRGVVVVDLDLLEPEERRRLLKLVTGATRPIGLDAICIAHGGDEAVLGFVAERGLEVVEQDAASVSLSLTARANPAHRVADPPAVAAPPPQRSPAVTVAVIGVALVGVVAILAVVGLWAAGVL